MLTAPTSPGTAQLLKCSPPAASSSPAASTWSPVMGVLLVVTCAHAGSHSHVMLIGQLLWALVIMLGLRLLARTFVLPGEDANITHGSVKKSLDSHFTVFCILNVKLRITLAKAAALVQHLAFQKLRIGILVQQLLRRLTPHAVLCPLVMSLQMEKQMCKILMG